MLQTRTDNEQFNSLPDIFTNNRSRNGFISTDRPDSSHRVDLHVYVVPKTVWRNVQHLAQNEAMNDAISAGFVRVSPDLNLHDLRDTIEQLCRNESYFPRDFIYLRSVGRCLTRVKSKQEVELKVKNYRPPQTFAPEIYLLEGRHEDYTSTPSASPALSSASYLFGNRYQHPIHHSNDQRRTPIEISPPIPLKPVRSEKRRLPALKTKSFSNGPTPTERKSAANLTSSGSTLDIDEPPMKELFRVKEEQERLRHRQIELERMRRLVEAKKARQEHSEMERRRPAPLAARREVVSTERRIEIDRSPLSVRRSTKPEIDRNRKDIEEKAATKIQATFRGFKSRQQIRERHRKFILQRRDAEAKRVRQIEEDAKQKAKELEERRRRNLVKRQKRNDVESLRLRLKDIQKRRTELEQIRSVLVKGLPNIHHQIQVRRKEARDMWKKKYYAEKKKTPALEDQQRQLKLDLEQIQQKILQTIENESKHSSQMGHLKGSEINNFILQITRIQHQNQDLNYQIDHAKLRLTTDIKLRSQAEHECSTMRHELNQAKMNLNHIKNRVEI